MVLWSAAKLETLSRTSSNSRRLAHGCSRASLGQSRLSRLSGAGRRPSTRAGVRCEAPAQWSAASPLLAVALALENCPRAIEKPSRCYHGRRRAWKDQARGGIFLAPRGGQCRDGPDLVSRDFCEHRALSDRQLSLEADRHQAGGRRGRAAPEARLPVGRVRSIRG